MCVSWAVFSQASSLGLDAVRKREHLTGQHVEMIRKEDGQKDRARDYPSKMKEYKI